MKNSHLVTLMSAYYEHVDASQDHAQRAAELKERILQLADTGRYGRYKIGRVHKAKIFVHEYYRNAYSYIRRCKGEA